MPGDILYLMELDTVVLQVQLYLVKKFLPNSAQCSFQSSTLSPLTVRICSQARAAQTLSFPLMWLELVTKISLQNKTVEPPLLGDPVGEEEHAYMHRHHEIHLFQECFEFIHSHSSVMTQGSLVLPRPILLPVCPSPQAVTLYHRSYQKDKTTSLQFQKNLFFGQSLVGLCYVFAHSYVLRIVF